MSDDRGSISRHLTPSLFISLLALFVALSSGAYAVSTLRNGEVKTRNIAAGAVTSAKVKDGSLRLHDLGGKIAPFTRTTASTVVVAANTCVRFDVGLVANPAEAGMTGSLVTGYLTTAQGAAVLTNAGSVVPTVLSETTQGGIVANLLVCASSSQTIPAGSVFHVSIAGR